MIKEIIDEIQPFFNIETLEKDKGVYVIKGRFNDPFEYSLKEVKKIIANNGFTGIFQKDGELSKITLGILIKKEDKGITPIHILLFLITIISTLVVGAIHAEVNVIKEPLLIYKGIPFSFSLLLILGGHELGHYFTCKRFEIVATPPYFIPFPHPLIGTMGAFIKMKSPVPHKKALLWTGGMGPIVGFVLSIIVSSIGLPLSKIIYVEEASQGIHLGVPLIMAILQKLLISLPSSNYDIILHPMAFAGWIGFFVTALNLIPLGQLDGGHIVYALFGKKRLFYQIPIMIILFILGFFWSGWWFWILIVSILGLKHPPLLDEISQFSKSDYIFSGIILMVLILSFILIPFQI